MEPLDEEAGGGPGSAELNAPAEDGQPTPDAGPDMTEGGDNGGDNGSVGGMLCVSVVVVLRRRN